MRNEKSIQKLALTVVSTAGASFMLFGRQIKTEFYSDNLWAIRHDKYGNHWKVSVPSA